MALRTNAPFDRALPGSLLEKNVSRDVLIRRGLLRHQKG